METPTNMICRCKASQRHGAENKALEGRCVIKAGSGSTLHNNQLGFQVYIHVCMHGMPTLPCMALAALIKGFECLVLNDGMYSQNTVNIRPLGGGGGSSGLAANIHMGLC